MFSNRYNETSIPLLSIGWISIFNPRVITIELPSGDIPNQLLYYAYVWKSALGIMIHWIYRWNCWWARPARGSSFDCFKDVIDSNLSNCTWMYCVMFRCKSGYCVSENLSTVYFHIVKWIKSCPLHQNTLVVSAYGLLMKTFTPLFTTVVLFCQFISSRRLSSGSGQLSSGNGTIELVLKLLATLCDGQHMELQVDIQRWQLKSSACNHFLCRLKPVFSDKIFFYG